MSKKVALLGNMNNFNYCITRYLRDKGIDAHLFLGDEFSHFTPQSDDYNNDQMPEFIHELKWHVIGHWKIDVAQIKRDMSGFDFIIATDRSIAYLSKAGIIVDLFIPHGGDIFYLPFYQLSSFPPRRYEIGAWYQSFHQRKGIRNARNILMDYMNPEFEAVFKKLNYRNNRIKLGFPAIYTPIYEAEYIKEQSRDSSELQRLKNFKEGKACLIFNNSRLVWTNRKEQQFHFKGNDRLLKAVANLIQKEKINLGIVLFEYGMDVEPTKQLVEKLGIQENVLWFNRMNRKQIIPLMLEADIVSSEFEHSWIMGGVIVESLMTKKILLGYRRDQDYGYYPELYPMLNASTQEQIEERIQYFLNNREKCTESAIEAHNWFMRNFIDKSIQTISDLITNKGPND